jgi:predicted TIM-barrel fold metal-dependent hydrolase
VPLEQKPSEYFRERVWISCDPDERTIPSLADRFGAERFMWASDFPHADHPPPDPALPPCAAAPRRHCHLGWPEYIDDLAELASAFPESDRRAFLGGNCRALFGIPATATATATVRTTT